ncbi:hypothetical protein V1512DRAFT_265782 [Lipomyces arxii]|uniref:uncharacterized protein n=1 Tax=Lipomyces arxii TaxID=56418 RepID=UPI0034CF9224
MIESNQEWRQLAPSSNDNAKSENSETDTLSESPNTILDKQKSPAAGQAKAQIFNNIDTSEADAIAVTTRKSKACPACRKQKIKCVMGAQGQPCRRCAERGLFCSPNKTLQSLMRDQSLWNARAMRHIAKLEVALNDTRQALSLSTVNLSSDESDNLIQAVDVKLSPEVIDEDGELEITAPTPESVATAPIQSLYEVTRPKAFRDGNDTEQESSGFLIQPDFVSKGIISVSDAERLANLYINRIDHYFYGHLGKFHNFAAVRKSSTLLALMICLVAAIHDPFGSEIYERLNGELRVMMISVMFKPRLAESDILALCIGTYWLSDSSWMLAGLAIRKAISMQYHKAHLNQPTFNRAEFEHSQLWLLTYLCNEQISILQGVPPSGVTSDYVRWQQHCLSSFITDADSRCVSHIDLLLIISRARELYGLDTTKPIPLMLVPQLREFIIQVDRWGMMWSGKLARNAVLGNFPSEAVQVQYRFAKFYLCSHAFRGLTFNKEDEGVGMLRELDDIAQCAISTAFAILRALLNSEELRAGLVGVPHFFHTMYTFAAVFLLKVSSRYTQYVEIDQSMVFSVITQVVDVFSHSPCARQHLVHRITRGLKEMLDKCAVRRAVPSNHGSGSREEELHYDLFSVDLLQPLDLENFDFLSSLPL